MFSWTYRDEIMEHLATLQLGMTADGIGWDGFISYS
jgi:hypothetical protein